MTAADMLPLTGTVEIGEGLLGGSRISTLTHDSIKEAKVVCAAEINDMKAQKEGRIKMRHVPEFTEEFLVPFVKENISKGACLIVREQQGYEGLDKEGYEVKIKQGKARASSVAEAQIELLQQWLLQTHRGAVTCKHLQHYIDEFCFRHNWRYKSVEEVIYRVLVGTTKRSAVPYWKLVGRPSPGRPLRDKG